MLLGEILAVLSVDFTCFEMKCFILLQLNLI